MRCIYFIYFFLPWAAVVLKWSLQLVIYSVMIVCLVLNGCQLFTKGGNMVAYIGSVGDWNWQPWCGSACKLWHRSPDTSFSICSEGMNMCFSPAYVSWRAVFDALCKIPFLGGPSLLLFWFESYSAGNIWEECWAATRSIDKSTVQSQASPKESATPSTLNKWNW